MTFNLAQLDTLVTIAETGSFDAAAARLQISSSAVSQRIHALESIAGQILISRGNPCHATTQGERLVQLGRQTRMLYDEARRDFDRNGSVRLSVAVHADSLSTWFREVLVEAATWERTSFVLRLEDEEHSQDLLRGGEVLAAVSSAPVTVQGCDTEPLGTMRYVPVAAPGFASRWHRGGSPAAELNWPTMPMVVFNDQDRIQHDYLRQHGMSEPFPTVHQVPSAADFYEAVRLGLGWGMVPEPQARAGQADGSIVILGVDAIDVPLHWQHWRLDSPIMAALTETVRGAARRHLVAPQGASTTSTGPEPARKAL